MKTLEEVYLDAFFDRVDSGEEISIPVDGGDAQKKRINRRHAKRWAYSKTASLLDTVMAEGWPHFEGFLPETADKLAQALHEVRDSLVMKGLLESDPDIWSEKGISVVSKARMKELGLCTQPDRHEPKLVCGYPLPCPHHTLVLEEEQALEQLDQVDAGEEKP